MEKSFMKLFDSIRNKNKSNNTINDPQSRQSFMEFQSTDDETKYLNDFYQYHPFALKSSSF